VREKEGTENDMGTQKFKKLLLGTTTRREKRTSNLRKEMTSGGKRERKRPTRGMEGSPVGLEENQKISLKTRFPPSKGRVDIDELHVDTWKLQGARKGPEET